MAGIILIKAGDVETNPGLTTTHKQVWICDICHKEETATIPDQKMYPVSCQVSKVLVLSPFFYSVSNSLSPNLQYIANKHLFKKNAKTHLWEKLLAVDQDDYIYF